MIIWVCDHPGTEVIFIQRFYREIHLIFVSITHPPPPPPPSSSSSPKLALLPCLAFPPPVLTVAISNLATPREVASVYPFQSRFLILFALRCTRGQNDFRRRHQTLTGPIQYLSFSLCCLNAADHGCEMQRNPSLFSILIKHPLALLLRP